jgi:DNA polymerase III alpha subunit
MRIRSEYSFRYAYGKLPNVFKRVQELNWNAAPLSDRLSTFGFSSWNELCKKNNTRPIFGVEIGVTSQLGQKRPSASYWTFFAIDKLRSINELVFKATSKSGHYPFLTYEEAMDATGVVKIADQRVFIPELHENGNFYCSLAPSIPIGLFRMAKEKGYKFIASSDNVFCVMEDKLPYHVLLNKNAETAPYPQYIMTDEEWRASLPYCVTDEDANLAIENRTKAMELCQAPLLKAELFVPQHNYSLTEMCERGATELNVNLNNPIYAKRLEGELDLIHEKNFQDYFYIVADLVAFAKRNMIVGPGRGSAAGSLVCYLTGITAIDPIRFGLLFERFIDVTRADLPDIDLDFSDEKRYLVFDYIKEKYGFDHVARLGSVLTYKPKSIINTAGAALSIPRWMCNQVADTLIERSSKDSRALQTFEETFSATEIGRKMIYEYPEISAVFNVEDHATNAGTHAAGIAITSGNVLDYVAIDGRNGAVMADKYDADKLNILKIDVLGLSQLSVFERCLSLIGKEPRNGFLESLPLDDQKAFDVLNKKHFSGIFQANGKSLQILFQSIHTDRFDDLVAITSLSRPGPVASGGAVRWTKKRMGKEKVTYHHPLLIPYLAVTYGEVVYQEQVMSICRDIGRMDFRGITKIRKAMSKSLGVQEMNTLGEPFKKGALETGLDEKTIDTIWAELIQMGAWSFNLSHAVSYGLVTYWCCWLKAHYPVEFAAATLDNEYDAMKQLMMLRELSLEGVFYKPLDIKYSTDRWAIANHNGVKTLVGPLTNIKGVGPVTVKKIMDSRLPGGAPLSPSVLARLEAASTKIDSLTPIRDSIRKLHPDLTKINIISEPTPIIDLYAGMDGIFTILALVKRIQPRDENDLHSLAKRGGKRIEGQSWSLNMFVHDDTDEILCKIERDSYLDVGKKIEEIGGQNDALYAIRGRIPRTFRMILIDRIRFLGKISDIEKTQLKGPDLFGPTKKVDLFGPIVTSKPFLIQLPKSLVAE